jgi:LysR substrate binding domain-containing protein
VRFRRTSKLDEYLARLLADRGLAPRTVGRASQISTAVRLAAEGLGVTIAPSSAIPDGFEHLTRPLRPALSEPVIAGVRRAPGRAETALLDQLKGRTGRASASARRRVERCRDGLGLRAGNPASDRASVAARSPDGALGAQREVATAQDAVRAAGVEQSVERGEVFHREFRGGGVADALQHA